MNLEVKTTKDGKCIVDVILKEEKTGEIVIFFPSVICSFGKIFGYTFNGFTHKEFYMSEFEKLRKCDMPGLAISLYQATSDRKSKAEYKVVKGDSEMYQKHRWDGKAPIELACGEMADENGEIKAFSSISPTIFSQEWYEELTSEEWEDL